MAILKRVLRGSVGKDVDKESVYTVRWECKFSAVMIENATYIPQKIKNRNIIKSSNSSIWYAVQGNEIGHLDSSAPMFVWCYS